MREQQLLHLPRAEKKHCVRGWNASAGASTELNPALQRPVDGSSPAQETETRPFPGAQHTVGAMATCRSTDSTCGAEPPEQQAEPLPLTVWHVRHAYRARARRVEHASAHKMAGAVRGSRENLAVYKRAAVAKAAVQASRGRTAAAGVLAPTHGRGPSAPSADQDERLPAIYATEEEQGARLDGLSAARISSDAGHRDELLAAIRRHLSAGQRVVLRSDGDASRGSSVGDARLAVQLLCALSLRHCQRDQGVVPQVDGACVQLELLPRGSLP